MYGDGWLLQNVAQNLVNILSILIKRNKYTFEI